MNIYVTYLTIYSGNKLPPFYIGSSTIEKINNGYRGSVKSKKYKSIWKQELKENPHLFKTKIISKHTNRKEALEKEDYIHRKLNVVKSPLYINMALASGCFGDNEYVRKHNILKYGFNYYVETEEFKLKSKQTRLEKYGSENYNNIEKIKQTNLFKYGCTCPSKNPKIIEKTAKTNIKKYGTSNAYNIPFFTILETRKTFTKGLLSRWHPEFKQYF